LKTQARRDMETVKAGSNDAPSAASAMAETNRESAPAELDSDTRKRLVNFDVNPGGDI
jgi:hypothetical protein